MIFSKWILAKAARLDIAYGTLSGRVKPGRFPFLRVSTDELEGKIKGYAGEGASTDDPLETFGVYGVSQVDNLQQLLRFICENGYENHVAMDMPQSADAIQEALNNEMGWKI